jgi:hypothetical protein
MNPKIVPGENHEPDLQQGGWFSPDTPVSSTNKTDCHDITEILFKVALNIINQLNQQKINHEKCSVSDYCSPVFRNVLLLDTFRKLDRFGSRPGYLPKLEFTYFKFQLFTITAITLLQVSGMYGC